MNKNASISINGDAMIETKSIAFREKLADEPQWLYDIRHQAWNFYVDSPLPIRVSNLWRYSDPKQFLASPDQEKFAMLPAIGNNSAKGIGDIDPELAGYGRNFADRSSVFGLRPEYRKFKIIFGDLSQASIDHPQIVRQYLGRSINYDFGKFEAFNLATWSVGTFILVPDNVIVDKPIYIMRHPAGPATTTRLLAIIGKNSEVTIIDDYNCHCRHEGEILNNVVELFSGVDSKVNYFQMQRLGPASRVHTTQRLELDSGARGQSFFASIGGHSVKINAGTALNGRHASSGIYGVAFADSDQKFDHHTFHRHNSSDTSSDIDFKVMLKDKSVSAYTGLIRIEKNAFNCEAYQENRNLLLNDGTKAESIPELEILNDQVRCTHGATMGPVDPEMIFYLRSRGYSEKQAVSSIVRGFIEPTLQKMPNDLAHVVRELVHHKLGDD